MFIYLVCHERRGPHQRDEVVATFWPESDDARGRNALRQAIFVLRDTLGEDVILANGCQQLQANPDRVGSDVREFEEAVRRGQPEEALALYRADFLAGFGVPGGTGFDDWMENRRLQLKGTAFSCAQQLAHAAEGQRDLPSAVHWWRTAQRFRPFDERILRRIMALLAGSSNRGGALAEFARFRHRMGRELESEPSEETRELAKAVAVRLPKHVPMWIGDRRREPADGVDAGKERHPGWRRPSDREAY